MSLETQAGLKNKKMTNNMILIFEIISKYIFYQIFRRIFIGWFLFEVSRDQESDQTFPFIRLHHDLPWKEKEFIIKIDKTDHFFTGVETFCK